MAHRGRENADEAPIGGLAGGLTVEAAAEKAGISPRTAHRRLEDAAFRQRVTLARGEMVSRALGRMANGMAAVARTLRKLLAAEADSVKLGAARSILELGTKLRESVDLETRLVVLEEREREKP